MDDDVREITPITFSENIHHYTYCVLQVLHTIQGNFSTEYSDLNLASCL